MQRKSYIIGHKPGMIALWLTKVGKWGFHPQIRQTSKTKCKVKGSFLEPELLKVKHEVFRVYSMRWRKETSTIEVERIWWWFQQLDTN